MGIKLLKTLNKNDKEKEKKLAINNTRPLSPTSLPVNSKLFYHHKDKNRQKKQKNKNYNTK